MKWDLGCIWVVRFERMDLGVLDGMAPHGHLVHTNVPWPIDSPWKVVVHNQIGFVAVVGVSHIGVQQPPGRHMVIRECFAFGGVQQLSCPTLEGNYRRHHIHLEKEEGQEKVRDKLMHHMQALNAS